MNTQHTPGPYYRYLTLLKSGTPGSIKDSVLLAKFERAEDASFAMRACNSHAELLAALEAVNERLADLPLMDPTVALVRAAIAKAVQS
jgi:hypothetical protein